MGFAPELTVVIPESIGRKGWCFSGPKITTWGQLIRQVFTEVSSVVEGLEEPYRCDFEDVLEGHNSNIDEAASAYAVQNAILTKTRTAKYRS